MKQYLKHIVDGGNLSREDTHNILVNITLQKYPDAQIAALLAALQTKKVTVDELLGFRDGILETGVHIDISDYKVIDIVGTGGDGKNTFNISTCSSFVVAGAGYKVAKHGNYAATSVSGASNVIEGHGVKFTNDNDKIRRSLDECNVIYLHAQLFAKAMKFVGAIRKDLQIPTVFNLLGPLVNPARPTFQMLGVATLPQMDLYEQVYKKLGTGFSIVNTIDGYDEISLTEKFIVCDINGKHEHTPEEHGFKRALPNEICGTTNQTKEDALTVFDNVLQNKATQGQKDVVLINSAYAIKTIEPQRNIEDCLDIARHSIESGKAWANFKKYVELNS